MLAQATGRWGEGVGSLTDVQHTHAPRSLTAVRLRPPAETIPSGHQVIAVERPSRAPLPVEPEKAPEPAGQRLTRPTRPTRARRLRAWALQVPSGGGGVAIALTVALLAGTAGGGGLLEGRIAFDVQARAAAAHQNWAVMRADGIPDSELAILEQEWIYSQKVKFLGVGTLLSLIHI